MEVKIDRLSARLLGNLWFVIGIVVSRWILLEFWNWKPPEKQINNKLKASVEKQQAPPSAFGLYLLVFGAFGCLPYFDDFIGTKPEQSAQKRRRLRALRTQATRRGWMHMATQLPERLLAS